MKLASLHCLNMFVFKHEKKDQIRKWVQDGSGKKVPSDSNFTGF